jgi:hypothetical protein
MALQVRWRWRWGRIAALLHPAGRQLLELQLDHGHHAEALRLADELAAREAGDARRGNRGRAA